ncbi:Serine/threonine protein [Heracleum sosnowskyi]|uniref:Serine/threonine protein n=1 Tax=Heracleum sosnowskyi TaxID=360622 RepID=A0AAD8IYA4_9APIA|nr:Serine/threonine protein [Heracleum sosnowskyi]
MAFEQSTVPVDHLRPLHLGKTVVEEPRISPVTVIGKHIEEGLYVTPPRSGSPDSIPVYYQHAPVSDATFVGVGGYGNSVTVSDSGYVGLGYGNAGVPGVAGWVQRIPSPGAPPSAGFGCFTIGNRTGGNNSDQASDEGGDDSNSGKKVKFLCSFGGKILPRPSDGALRYVGGQTRIISVRRDVSFEELIQKLADAYGQTVGIKYQLPEEDLDALVSVSSPDDLEHLMDEYEKLLERCMDGSPKLRMFLSSTSELDSPEGVQMGDFEDNGQRYVEAVNGAVDRTGPGIVRKESILSVTSTQNSDMSGNEPENTTCQGHSDVTRAPSTGELSPRCNSVASQESVTRFVCVDPNPAIYVETSASPSGIQMVRSHTPATSVQPVTIVQPQSQLQPQPQPPQQMNFDIQQQKQMGFQGPAVPFQSYVDAQQEAINHADYVQYASQMGFPTRVMGNVGPLYAQQQYRDNAVNVSPHQFITGTSPSSYANIKPNPVQQIVQPQHVRLERYLEENTYGQRVVQFSGDQGYNTYHTQVSQQGTSGYGWQQGPQLEPVTISEAWLPHPQVVYPEKLPKYHDCYMCQKALPHAHSDTVAHARNDSPTSSTGDLNSYLSLQSEDSTRYRPINKGVVNGPMGVDMVEKQVTGAQLRIVDKMNHETIKPQYGEVLVSTNVERQFGNDIILQREFNHDHPQTLFPQGGAGMTGGVHPPYSVITGVVPQFSQESAVQKPVVQAQYQIKQEALINKAVIVDDASTGDTSSQNSDLHESPQSCYSNISGYIPKESTLEPSLVYDQLRKSDGRTEKVLVWAPENFAKNEPGMPVVDISRKKDIVEHKTQLIASTDPYGDKAYSKPKMILETNRCKQNETLSCLSNEVSYSHTFQPMNTREVTQSVLVNAAHPHSRLVVNQLGPDGAACGNPTTLPVVNSPQVSERTALIGEWNDSPPRVKPNLACVSVEPVHSDNSRTSSLSPSSRAGDMEDNSNSLFSSQDPWYLRHDAQLRGPRPNRFLTKKEAYFGDQQFGSIGEPPARKISGSTLKPDDRVILQSGKLDTENSAWSNRGSAEEHIKKEVNGSTAPVLLPSLSNHDLSSHGSGSASEANDNSGAQYSGVEVHHTDTDEDNKSKLPERANLGFPVSDGIGRLQIIKNSDLEELRELGSGTFGTVYHGNWRGSEVAIKRISNRCFAGKPSEQERMRDDFWNEAINLADLHHPNVVAFYGVVLDGPGDSVATVTEYMVNGSLRTALQKNEKSLNKRKRLLIAMDVAFGMEYLHGKNIVHFDLKSDNLLVNLRDPHRPICKVGDLGLSKVKCQTLISGGVRGTLPWMAPELLNGSSSLVSEKVDVFSFGVVLWELLTGDEPYADLHYGAIIGGIVSNTLRPPIPEYCDSEWKSLMESCWSTEPLERPKFSEVANQLRSLAAKVPPKMYLHH